MLQQLNRYVSALRSDLLMGKYQQAMMQYQHINKLLPILDSLNVSPKELEQIKSNVKVQMEQAQEIINLLQPSNEEFVEKVQKIGDQTKRIKKNIEKEVGKWGAKSSKWKKTNLYESQKSQLSPQKIEQAQERQEKIMQNKQSKIPEQDCEKIEREIVLPLTLPDLFKNKPPSRLIICPLEQVKALINLLSESILIRLEQTKSVEELESKCEKQDDQTPVYVIPWIKQSERVQIINRKLEQNKCLIILYSDQLKFMKIQKCLQ